MKKELKLDKKKCKNKEEVGSSGVENDNKSLDELNSKMKNNDNQESYFNNGMEEATNMGADTEVNSVWVLIPSCRLNNAEDFDENIVEKSKKEQSEESTKSEQVTKINKNNQELNTKTKKATNMGANTEVIGVLIGLQNHVERFHVNGAAESKRTVEEEEAERGKESKSKSTSKKEKSTGLLKSLLIVSPSFFS